MSDSWSPAELALAERMSRRDIVSIRQFSADELETLLDIVERFEGAPPTLLQGRVLAALFFEPSTRTRLSFESAMCRLGGSCIGFAEAKNTSTAKGESLPDTLRMVEQYCDIVVIRHPREGAARLAAESTHLPVINGGDGANQHPTQTLLDLYTIRSRCKRLRGLKIGFVGDLKYGRAAHSLIEALGMLGNDLTLISPASLRLSERRLEDLDEMAVTWRTSNQLAGSIEELDVLYVTRIQRERFGDPLHYERVKNSYQIDAELLETAAPEMIVMHPLPRVNEIATDVDDSPRAAYFEQARNGLTVRKTLLALALGVRP